MRGRLSSKKSISFVYNVKPNHWFGNGFLKTGLEKHTVVKLNFYKSMRYIPNSLIDCRHCEVFHFYICLISSPYQLNVNYNLLSILFYSLLRRILKMVVLSFVYYILLYPILLLLLLFPDNFALCHLRVLIIRFLCNILRVYCVQ